MIYTGLCVRGLRQHDKGARAPLPPPQGEAPLLSGAPQVLRQEALQVQQLELCLHAAAGNPVVEEEEAVPLLVISRGQRKKERKRTREETVKYPFQRSTFIPC